MNIGNISLQLALLAVSTKLYASVVYVPDLVKRVEHSDLIISGEITNTITGTQTTNDVFSHNEKFRIDYGCILIRETLKGVSNSSITIAFHTPLQAPSSFNSRYWPKNYTNEQRGIWMLSKDKSEDYYWASAENDFRELDRRNEVEKAIVHASKKTASKLEIYLMSPDDGDVSLWSYYRNLNTQYIEDVYLHNRSKDTEYTVKQGDFISATISNHNDTPGCVKLAKADFSVIDKDTIILPGERIAIARLTITTDKTGRFEFDVFVKCAIGSNSRLDAWRGSISGDHSDAGEILDPNRYSRAIGNVRNLADWKETDLTRYLAEMEKIGKSGDIAIIKDIQESLKLYPDLYGLMYDVLEELGKNKKANALYKCFDIVEEQYFGDINNKLRKCAGISRVVIPWPAKKRTYYYGDPVMGSREMSGEDVVEPQLQNISTERELFKLWWRDKLTNAEPTNAPYSSSATGSNR